MSEIRVVFDHIPKTAGSAIIRTLSEILPLKPHRIASGAHRRIMLESEKVGFVAGHLWFAPGERLLPGRYYMTTLRDPVDRFLSHYYFARHDFDPGEDFAAATARKLSIDDYVQSEDSGLIDFYSNVQARHFAALALGPQVDPARIEAKALLEAAKTALDDYALIGVFPKLQKFINRICDQFQLPRKRLPIVNATSKRLFAADLSTATRSRLQEANQVDQELVTWAVRRIRSPTKFFPFVASASATILDAEKNFGSREIEITKVVCHQNRRAQKLRFEIECNVRHPTINFTIGMAIIDAGGREIFGTNTYKLGIPLGASERGRRKYSFSVRPLPPVGQYSLTIAAHLGNAHTEGCFHWKDGAVKFEVLEQTAAASRKQLQMKAAFFERVPRRRRPPHEAGLRPKPHGALHEDAHDPEASHRR